MTASISELPTRPKPHHKFDGRLRAFRDLDAARECSKWLRVIRTQGEGVNTAGGFLTPIETLTSAILAYRDRVGLARRFANVIPLRSDNTTVPRAVGRLTASFVDENAESTETDNTYGTLGFVAKKVIARTRTSTELEEDAGSGFFADFLAAEIGWALAALEDQTVIQGDGTDTYKGQLGLDAAYTAGLSSYVGAVDAAAGVDSFSEITATDLGTALAEVPTWALANAAWYCSQIAAANVFYRLAGSNGGIGRNAAGENTFWGLPIRVSNYFATDTGDLSDVPMLYVGDLTTAVHLGSRRDLRLMRTIHRYFEYDQVAYMGSTRFHVIVDPGDATAASGLIALMGE